MLSSDAKLLLVLCGKDYNKELETFADTAPTTISLLIRDCFKQAVVGKELEIRLLNAWNLIKAEKPEIWENAGNLFSEIWRIAGRTKPLKPACLLDSWFHKTWYYPIRPVIKTVFFDLSHLAGCAIPDMFHEAQTVWHA